MKILVQQYTIFLSKLSILQIKEHFSPLIQCFFQTMHRNQTPTLHAYIPFNFICAMYGQLAFAIEGTLFISRIVPILGQFFILYNFDSINMKTCYAIIDIDNIFFKQVCVIN